MDFQNFIPVIGKDGNGRDVMMTMTSSGSNTSPSVEITNANQTDNTWEVVTIDSIQSTPNGILATGYATKKIDGTINIGLKKSGSWTAGVVDFSGIRDDSGISYYGSNFLVAANDNVRVSPFNFISGTTVGNLSSTVFVAPNASDQSITCDNISSTGTYVVATSIAVKLVWNPVGAVVANGPWESYAGEPRSFDTGHLSTSYTFPGYAGGNAQVQRTVAVSNEGPYDPPTLWDTVSTNNEGFYGLTQCPHFDFTWTQ